MNPLSWVFAVKIGMTLVLWALPLILLPCDWLEWIGFPSQPSYLFLRLLGWAYLALGVGYTFGWRFARQRRRAMGPIWAGIVSNGGACVVLLYYGLTGAFESLGSPLQFILWFSALALGGITLGLIFFGLRGPYPRVT